MKKILLTLVILLTGCLLFSGCGMSELKMTQKEMLDTLYDGVDLENDLPALGEVEINDDNIESYLGKKYEIVEGIASEPMMGSNAHSVVIVKLADGVDIQNTVNEILQSAKDSLYRKWICVEAEKIEVKSYGHTVILVMTNEKVDSVISKNFDKLK